MLYDAEDCCVFKYQQKSCGLWLLVQNENDELKLRAISFCLGDSVFLLNTHMTGIWSNNRPWFFFASGFCPGAGLYFDLFLNKILFILRKSTPSFLPSCGI